MGGKGKGKGKSTNDESKTEVQSRSSKAGEYMYFCEKWKFYLKFQLGLQFPVGRINRYLKKGHYAWVVEIKL